MAELIIKLQEREIRRIPITRQVTSIGRDEDQDVVIDNPAVSRRHAAVEFEAGEFIIRDLGSDNGMFVNGEPVKRWRLAKDDYVQLGKFTLVFSPSGGVPDADLMPVQPIEPVETKPRRNPIATTSLSTQDLQRFREQAEAERQSEEAAAAAASASPTPPGAAAGGSSGVGMLMVGLFAGVAIGAIVFFLIQR